MREPAKLLILAEASTWERRFQVTSLAASSAASGDRVDIALFFAALASWVDGSWDQVDPSPPLRRDAPALADYPPLSSLLEEGRRSGLIGVFACSASTRFLDLEPGRVQEKVDAIMGWPSFASMIRQAERVVTF